MKKFVSIVSTKDEYEQIKTRLYLNSLGFYVLSLPNNMLEVNVIVYKYTLFDMLMTYITGRKLYETER